VLIVAALLKGQDIVTDPIAGLRIGGARWLLLVFAELEFVLGLWLLSHRDAQLARVFSLAFFTIFAAVSGYKAWLGEESCGCLGWIRVPPLYSLGFNLGALVTLFVWCPKEGGRWNASDQRGLFSRGRAVFVVGTVLLLIGTTGFAWLNPGDGVVRHVTLHPEIHDFGEVAQGQTLTHVFTLSNNWDRPVRVVKVSTGCGCTVVDELIGQVVEPQSSLEMPVRLHTGDSESHRSVLISVFYAAPSQRIPTFKTLQVVANVVTDYWVRPTVVDFGLVQNNHPVSRTVRIRPNYLPDVRILGVKTYDPAFSARPIDSPAGSTDLLVDVTFSTTALSCRCRWQHDRYIYSPSNDLERKSDDT
jgi:hypothetical protein